ncbi:hypothetical protein J6590_050278 [Homalodisca vitripennis]|nr:hypothetical protein J6590_050278 [Homalodisca vitripennis]
MDDTQQTTISNVKPKERLVKVFTSGDTSGEMLLRELKKCLTALNLDPKGIVGQSMDGAGNMRGQFKGLKSLVTKENPKAFYATGDTTFARKSRKGGKKKQETLKKSTDYSLVE